MLISKKKKKKRFTGMDEHRFLGVALCPRELAPSYRSVIGDAVCSLNRSNEAFSDLLLTASSQGDSQRKKKKNRKLNSKRL